MDIHTYSKAHKYSVIVDGNHVSFGFNGRNEIALFGGSYGIIYPKEMTLDEVKADIKENYYKYSADLNESITHAYADCTG